MNNISDIISSRIKKIENTYSTIYNESIDDKEQFITKDFVRDTITNKKFFNGGRPIEKDDFRYEAFQNLEENVDIVYSVLSRLEFPLTVFRGLSVSPEKEIRLGGNIGEHWTTNWNIFYRKGEYGFNEPNVILSCKITPEMVNWEQTVLDRYSDVISEKEEYREYEIELKKGVIPDDIQIETDTRAFSD